MDTRSLVNFLLKTFMIGGIAGLVISFFTKSEEYAIFLSPFDLWEIFGLVIFFLGLGFTFSVVSMTGFFAYLFIHRFCLSIFKSFWPTVQVLLIAFVLFDLIYFPYTGTEGINIFWFILMAVALFAFAWIVAWKKAKETNRKAFIPTLFFMIVITTVEWVPGLQVQGTDYAWLMIAPLLACNTYQILTLHRINERVAKKKAKQQAAKKADKKKKKEKAQTAKNGHAAEPKDTKQTAKNTAKNKQKKK